MKYFFLPLTEKEANNPISAGYRFVVQNEGRLVEYPDLVEVNTYDKGTSMLVHENTVYTIFKDYTDLTNSRRIYIGKPNINGSECTKFD